MSCRYTHPSNLTVQNAFWCEYVSGTVQPVLQSKNLMGRVGAKCELETKRCSLRITNLRRSDGSRYHCRVTTNVDVHKWLGAEGTILSVTDLKVELVGAATEGNDVRLVCKTSCYLSSSPTYSWKKNGEPLEKEPTKNNELLLHPVSREDGGRYSCAVKGHEDLSSAEVELDVRYPPKNTRVLGAPPAEIPEGGSVTLSCSSDANPPVQNYTWFKENVTSPVAAGQNFTIISITFSDKGSYHCQARNDVGVQNSAAVSLQPRGRGTWTIVAVTLAVTVPLVVFCGVLLTMFCCRKRPGAESLLGVFCPAGCSAPEVKENNRYDVCEDDGSNQRNSVYQSLDLNAIQHDVYHTLFTRRASAHTEQQSQVPSGESIYQNVNVGPQKPGLGQHYK
ncbi:B-cell receptor CD22-like [Denticeps clupeoides]|uniref:B-cell receptor CD22-like n=1 Tax=Denticeps clupeoides TaxID=299321 RepID=UPI0010A333F4|nr:B-cell receptor CD22-like [Denticeps clupeoides]